MSSTKEITEVSKLSPSRRLAWFTTLVIIVLSAIFYFDRNQVIDVLKDQIVRLAQEDKEKDAKLEKETEAKEAAQEKYNRLLEKTFQYNDSVTKDNRKFINELKGIQ